MGFLAPLMLVGVLALAVPIAIHLIGRRRARVVQVRGARLPAGDEARDRAAVPAARARAAASSARSRALRDRDRAREAVHVVRAQGPAGRRAGRRPRCSSSTTRSRPATSSTASRGCARASDEARRILTQLGPEAEVAIVRAREGADHPTELTRDHLRLRDQLLALEPSARPADTTRALARAAQLLAASSHARKTVYPAVARSRRPGIRADEPPWGKDGPGARRRRSAAGARCRTSRSPRLRVDADPGTGTRGVAFDAEVANFSDDAAEGRARRSRSPIASSRAARSSSRRASARRRSGSSRRCRPARARPMHRSSTVAGDALGDRRPPLGPRVAARRGPRAARRRRSAHGAPRRRAVLPRGRAAPRRSRGQRHAGPRDHGRGARRHRARSARGKAGAIDLAELRRRSCSRTSPALPAERVAIARRVGRAPAAASWSRRAIASIPRRTTARCCRCLPQSLRDPIDTTWGASPRGSRQPRAPPREVGSRPPDLHAVLEGRARARRREVLQDRAARPDDRDRRSQGARALHERRRRARRGVDRRRPHAAVHVDARSRLERSRRSIPASCRWSSRPCATSRASTRVGSRPITSSAARSRCRPAISRSSRSAAPTASARCSKAIASPDRATVRFGTHRSPRHLSRDRHRSRPARPAIATSSRSSSTSIRAAPISRPRRPPRCPPRAPAVATRRPTPRAASSCGTRSRPRCCCCCSPRACSSSARKGP